MSVSALTLATDPAVRMILRIACPLLSGAIAILESAEIAFASGRRLSVASSLVSSSWGLVHSANFFTSSPFKYFVPMSAGLSLVGTRGECLLSPSVVSTSTLSAHVADLIRLRGQRLLMMRLVVSPAPTEDILQYSGLPKTIPFVSVREYRIDTTPDPRMRPQTVLCRVSLHPAQSASVQPSKVCWLNGFGSSLKLHDLVV